MKICNRILLWIAVLIVLLSGCTRNRRRPTNTQHKNERVNVAYPKSPRSKSTARMEIQMTKKGGVYTVPCKINGVEMEFIFDTGASDITMSLTEAVFLLKQGKLTKIDFVGAEQYMIADGSIHEGMVVNLKTVEIGNRKLINVRASIVDNTDAPLLLGQSALSRFGKISIDYSSNKIFFE